MKEKLFLSFIKNFKIFFKKYINVNIIYYIETSLILLFTNFLSIFPPLFSKVIVDDCILGKNFNLLVVILIISTSVSLYIMVSNSIIQYIFEFIIGKINFKINTDFFYHVIKLPLTFFDKKRTGEIINRCADSTLMNNFFKKLIFEYINLILSFSIGLVICLRINWILTITVFIFIPFYIIYYKKVNKITRKYENGKWEKDNKVTSEQYEIIIGIKLIKAFAAESRVIRKLKVLILRSRKYFMDFKRKNIFFDWIFSSFSTMENFIIFLLCGYFILNNKMTIGEWLAFQAISAKIVNPLRSIFDITTQLNSNLVTFKRLEYISSMKVENEILDSDHNIKKKIKGEIIFENVNFAYIDNNYVLENINLNIESGKSIAFVGQSGSGKTTLANLIPRFYFPNNGNVYIDNVNIKDYDLQYLRNQIGFVMQNTYHFYGSLYDSFLTNAPGKTKDDIIEACKIANAHEFICDLPNKYDTNIGEGGVNLSGGQKQRISIAQAILKNPKILILDEATSHLDIETEEKIQESLQKLIKGRTTIIIAHRLSTIINSDLICVIDKGKIVEKGNHIELIEKNSFYSKLFKKTTIL
jgi:ABC-type bacteriocin/lantibiotic exporter with double-glycine peptidase domain